MADPTIKQLEERLVRLEASIGAIVGARIPNFGPIVDPAPFPWPQPWPRPMPMPMPWPWPWPLPQPGDPSPVDFGQLTVSQIEDSLNSINSEKVRLDALEATLKAQLTKLRKK